MTSPEAGHRIRTTSGLRLGGRIVQAAQATLLVAPATNLPMLSQTSRLSMLLSKLLAMWLTALRTG